MRKVMVLQHAAHEPLGTLLPLLKGAGLRLRHVNFARDPDLQPHLAGYGGLIVLGGPMGVYEVDRYSHLRTEMHLIEEALRCDIPILGICLGAQLLAHVLGARVRKAPDWELGWYRLKMTEEAKADPLFEHYGEGEKIFEMHQDTFDLPSSVAHLAGTELCPSQAFRFGEKAYGLQFHLEADRATILRWLKRAENLEVIGNSNGRFNSDALHADTEANIERSLNLSVGTFRRFVELFNLPERRELLGSTR